MCHVGRVLVADVLGEGSSEENLSLCVTLDKTQPPASWLKAAAEENLSMCVALDKSQSPMFWFKAAA